MKPHCSKPRRCTKQIKRFNLLKWFIQIYFFFISSICVSQRYQNGEYVSLVNDKQPELGRTIKGKLTIKIKQDSIWWFRDLMVHQNGNISLISSISVGIIRDFNNAYLGSVVLTECDTCSLSWKKGIDMPFDSIYHFAELKKDVVIINRNFSEADQNRISHLFFNVLSDGNITEGSNIYKKE